MKKIVFLSILVIFGILFASQIRRGAISLLILIDSVRPPETSLMGKFIEGPSIKKVLIPTARGPIPADLYRPAKEGRHFPLLLVHGADSDGKDGEFLVLLAKNFARAGFLVLAPELRELKNFRFRLTDAEDVVESFRLLKRQENAGAGGGILGMDFGSGPALLAAADNRVRDKLTVIATLGGYYDLRNVLLFGMTGSYEYGGRRGYVRPEESLRWMVAYKNLDIVGSPPDRDQLRKIFELRNRYDFSGASLAAKGLGTQGSRIYDFLINTDQERFTPLYEKLPLLVRERVYQLSPARAIPSVKASFIMAHARDDFAVPYTETLRLGDAVGDGKRVCFGLLPQLLKHGTDGSSTINQFTRHTITGWRLFSLIYALLEKGGV